MCSSDLERFMILLFWGVSISVKKSIQKIYIMMIPLSFLLLSCSQKTWEESDLFESGPYTMIGEENELGFIFDDKEVVKFYPDKTNKYMWHFWGTEEELDGNLKVIGTHKEPGNVVTVIENQPIAVGEHNGADAAVPTQMSLPKSGMWKLDAFIDDKLHGSVYIRVHEKEEEAA